MKHYFLFGLFQLVYSFSFSQIAIDSEKVEIEEHQIEVEHLEDTDKPPCGIPCDHLSQEGAEKYKYHQCEWRCCCICGGKPRKIAEITDFKGYDIDPKFNLKQKLRKEVKLKKDL